MTQKLAHLILPILSRVWQYMAITQFNKPLILPQAIHFFREVPEAIIGKFGELESPFSCSN